MSGPCGSNGRGSSRTPSSPLIIVCYIVLYDGRILRLVWPWLFQNAITTLILAAGFAFAIAASLAGFPRTLRPTCIATFALFSLGEAVAAAGYWDQVRKLSAL
jgi:hypothetical protein